MSDTNFWENKKVLLTGATGFIGQNLVVKLLENRVNLTCVIAPWDNFCFKNPKIKEIKADLTKQDSITNITSDFDIVFHLAAKTDFEEKTYEEYKRINVDATLSLAKHALINKVEKFVFTGSIASAGLRYDSFFLNEEVEKNPINFYGKSKMEAENELLKLYKENGLPVAIIRPTTVYGPHDKSVFYLLAKTIKSGKYFQIGDGNNLVSYVYVENLIKGLILAAEKEEAKGQVITISDIYPYTMNRITSEIIGDLGQPKKIVHINKYLGILAGYILELLGKLIGKKMPLYPSRVKNLCSSYTYDISKAIKLLGYYPDYTIEEGIAKTIKWYKENELL